MPYDEQAAKLIVCQEGKPELCVELGERLTIGRSPNNQLMIEDQLASRNHAEILRIGGNQYQLSDLGSANGTWLNGRPVRSPRPLKDGDQILIGNVVLRFETPTVQRTREATMTQQTNLFLRNELVIVLVADIRNFTRMSEALPGREFSSLVSEWFRESSDIIQRHGGTIDKFIGDAVMAYWVVASKPDPAVAIHEALETARSLLATASIFSHRLSGQFPGNAFQIGIGLNMGDAMLGNVGTAENQSFTVVGDSVNVAFRLEALTKEQRTPILISQSIVDNAGKHQQFRELGLAEVKGRTTPVSIWTLDFGSEMEV